jgi:large subunit ribosomal protein L14
MIQAQTVLKVADNSGAKTVRCIRILRKGNNPTKGFIGDVLVVSVQKLRSRNRQFSKVLKGDVVLALVVKTKNPLVRPTGLSISYNENAVVLLNKQKRPLGTRMFGTFPKELRHLKFNRILTLSAGTI